MEQDLKSTINTAVSTPAEVSTEAGTVKARSVSELIEADKHLQARNAAKNSKTRGIHYAKFRQPGTYH